jgi:hypothetical protein
MTAAAHCLQLAGLIVGFAGALLLTISQRPGEIYQGTSKGEVAYIVLAHPRLWKTGLWLLVAGFVIQLLGQVVR